MMWRSALVAGALAVTAPALALTPQHDGTIEDDPVPAARDAAETGTAAVLARDAEAIVAAHESAGWTGMGGPYEPLTDYPPCTATRTDRCVQPVDPDHADDRG